MASDMVERVARVIDPLAYKAWEDLRQFCLAQGDSDEEALSCAETMHARSKEQARQVATAALKALREPTLEMVDEGNRAAGREAQWHCSVDEIWSAILSAAIGEG